MSRLEKEAISGGASGTGVNIILRDAPKPQMDWYVDESVTTISAAPVGPGETKFIGLGDKFSYVKSVLLSHVVEYYNDLWWAARRSEWMGISENVLYRKFAVQKRNGTRKEAKLGMW